MRRTYVSGPLGREEEWVEDRKVWGRISLARITTRMAFMQANQPTITHFVTLRDEVSLTPGDNRFECEGKIYEIVAAEGDPTDIGKFTRVEVRQINAV